MLGSLKSGEVFVEIHSGMKDVVSFFLDPTPNVFNVPLTFLQHLFGEVSLELLTFEILLQCLEFLFQLHMVRFSPNAKQSFFRGQPLSIHAFCKTESPGGLDWIF